MIENKKWLGVFSGGYAESVILKALLESYDIVVYQENFLLSTIKPWAISSGGFDASILRVDDNDLERAKRIIEDYNDNLYNFEV